MQEKRPKISPLMLRMRSLQLEMQWLRQLTHYRLNECFPAGDPSLLEKLKAVFQNNGLPPAPSLEKDKSTFAREIKKLALSDPERLLVILALYPHIQANLLDQCLDEKYFGNSLLGGQKQKQSPGFIATGQTALFLLAGNHLGRRLEFLQLLEPGHRLYQKGILESGKSEEDHPPIHQILSISEEYRHLLLLGQVYEPQFNPDFPAQKLKTQMSWEDLVLPWSARDGVEELKLWIRHYRLLMEKPAFAKERQGYKCLMYGDPGTGKTLTVKLLTLETPQAIFRISLDKLISKYVGETTKNIAKIFQYARNKDWILFFDEGDSLFSKRSNQVQSAQDSYVNQDVAYLLQQIEDYEGIIIVATNNLQSMDKAFFRRFDTIIAYQEPDEQLRKELWEKALTPFQLDEAIDLDEIARLHKKNAAFIRKVKHYLGIQSIEQAREIPYIAREDLEKAIQRNYD